MVSKSLKQLMLYAIGGGWGDEQPGAGKICVAVIRGTDIPKLRIGDHSSVPFRYESESKVRSRLLQVEDIVIEVSGGSAASGQHTGRALLVTAEILQSLGGKVIPASFCRLLRLDAQQVHPGFVVRQIDLLHQTGEIAEFENQSTGIANFQFNRFVEETHPRIKGLDAQTTIAEYISSFDRLISLNRRINQTLEAMAQAIFKSWFVDFDPVKAKIAAIEQGQDPLRAAMRAISGKTDFELDQMPRAHHDQLAATAALFPDAMEESELGEIPKGWNNGILADLCNLNPESWSAKTLPSTVHYVDLANTKNGEISELQAVSGKDIPSRARRVLRPGDTIVGTVRPGNRSFALIGEADLTGSTGFAVLRPSTQEWLEFVYLVATSESNIERLAHLADGGAYPAIRPEVVVRENVVIPTKNVVQAFHREVQPLFSRILASKEQVKRLAELRDTLLPKLISGELRVKNAKHIEKMEV